MKTKDEVKKSLDPSPGSLLLPPSPQGEGPDEIVRETAAMRERVGLDFEKPLEHEREAGGGKLAEREDLQVVVVQAEVSPLALVRGFEEISETLVPPRVGKAGPHVAHSKARQSGQLEPVNTWVLSIGRRDRGL